MLLVICWGVCDGLQQLLVHHCQVMLMLMIDFMMAWAY
jgi:hypothetical protein